MTKVYKQNIFLCHSLLIMILLLLLRVLTKWRIRRQPTSTPVVLNVTKAGDPQELLQQKPKCSSENN